MGIVICSVQDFSVVVGNSVRGYRENTLVRDRGFLTSVEFRIPVLFDKAGNAVVQIAPFYDWGGALAVSETTPQPKTISSAGLGLLITPNRHLHCQLYWGHPFRKIEGRGDDPQDLGLHFRISFDAF